MNRSPRRAWLLAGAGLLAAAAGEAQRQYRLRGGDGPLCAVAPCPNVIITDRLTGVAVTGDIRLLAPPGAPPTPVQSFDSTWDLLAEGTIVMEGGAFAIPVLHITRILGRVRRTEADPAPGR